MTFKNVYYLNSDMDWSNLKEYNKLDKELYLQSPEVVAKDLLGKLFVRKYDEEIYAGIIVEVEAYLSENDYASHSAVGKTKRNQVMFEKGGTLYVYKIYGVHHCINVVTENEGVGSAVLIRALEPIHAIDRMAELRNCNNIAMLCKGPGNVAKALNIDLGQNGISLLSDEIFIVDFLKFSDFEVSVSKRIGITKSEELLLRFFIKDSKFVSGKKSQNF